MATITKVDIKKFRKLKDIEIQVGKYITVIAGHNAIGKSTILGLLGHCGELPKNIAGETLSGNPFKADLSDMIKFSKEYDKHENPSFNIHFEDYDNNLDDTYNFYESIAFRAYWNKDKSKDGTEIDRYRIIPVKDLINRNTESKVKWPTAYLGLSRLFPIGESNSVTTRKKNNRLNELKEELLGDYAQILSLQDKITDFDTIEIEETSKKHGFGANTDEHDWRTNSAGQDNLGQILLLAKSFELLNQKLGDKWQGGMLLIDELDASLHPAAQNKLFNFLLRKSQEFSFQIAFTTHSLSLLEYISDYIESTPLSKNVTISYLSTARGLEVHHNPSKLALRADLTSTMLGRSFNNKVDIYSEDAEARWFYDALIDAAIKQGYFSGQIMTNHIDVNLGCDHLLKLTKDNFKHFGNCLVLLDGDVKDDKILEALSNSPYKKKYNPRSGYSFVILKTPTSLPPDQILWEYLNEIPEDHAFFLSHSFDSGISKRNLIEHGPESGDYDHTAGNTRPNSALREKYKAWFNDNKSFLDSLINFWIDDHPSELNNFVRNFVCAYEHPAKLNGLPKVTCIKQ